MPLNAEQFHQIIEIITPHVGDGTGRQALVQAALWDSPVLSQINWSGPANTFAVHLITTLNRFDTSTVVSLLQHLKTQVGSDKQARIDSIIAQIDGAPPKNSKIKILFLAANPTDTSKLRLDEEVRTIDEKLRASEFRDNFELLQHHAVRVTDIQSLMLRHKPHIVHFSGHGSQAGELILENPTGKQQAVSAKSLTGLFRLFSDTVRCVVLNACYSKIQAEAIRSEIECVVGMTTAIGDKAAIEFAGSFYQGLGYDRSIQMSYDLAYNQIGLSGLGEEDTPKLLCKPGVDASKIHLLQ